MIRPDGVIDCAGKVQSAPASVTSRGVVQGDESLNESEYTTAREGTCACGAVFTGPKCGPISALCPECRRRRKRGFGRTYYAVRRAERLANPQPVDKTGWIQCPYCHDLMPAWRKECGKPECTKKLKADITRQWHADYRERTGHGYAAPSRLAGNDYSNIYEHTCEWQPCGIVSKTHKQEQRYCSPEHYRLAQAEARRSKLLPILHPNPAPYSWLPVNHPVMLMQQRQVKRLFIGGTCARDGVAFVAHDESGVARYCSVRCARATGKDTHRARKRGVGHESYRRIDIFERDGYRCHICGLKTRQGAHYLHPLSPTIDHLVPLSKGGRDAPDNVACAHRQCNTVKSDTGGAQLLLVG